MTPLERIVADNRVRSAFRNWAIGGSSGDGAVGMSFLLKIQWVLESLGALVIAAIALIQLRRIIASGRARDRQSQSGDTGKLE